MYHNNRFRGRLIVLLLLAIAVTGCGPGATAPATEQGTSDLKPAEFTDPRPFETPDLPGETFYVSDGVYSNELGQNFVITVTGRLANAIQEYTKNTKFHLLATSLVKPSQQENVEVSPGKSLFAVLLSDPDTESLIIEIDLAPEDAKKLDAGYDLSFEIDPSVKTGYTHHYSARHVSPSLTTKIFVSIGRIIGNLYKNCSSTGATPISAGSTTTLPSSASGYAWYDLAVTGSGTAGASNSYSFVQGLWSNYSYYFTNTTAYTPSSETCW